MYTPTSTLYGQLCLHALAPASGSKIGVPRAAFLKALLDKGAWQTDEHPRDGSGRFSGKPQSEMMSRINARRITDTSGYYGLGHRRRSELDRDVGDILHALSVKESEAEAFLASRWGRLLASSIRHLRPTEDLEEVARQVDHHLSSYRRSVGQQNPSPGREASHEVQPPAPVAAGERR